MADSQQARKILPGGRKERMWEREARLARMRKKKSEMQRKIKDKNDISTQEEKDVESFQIAGKCQMGKGRNTVNGKTDMILAPKVTNAARNTSPSGDAGSTQR